MLQTMRNNAQGTIAKVIVGFIIVVFALWGVESIVSIGGGEKPLAKVGDYEIYKAELDQRVATQKSELRRQFGENYDESLFNEKFLRQSALEQLINEKVNQQQAQEADLFASQAMIDKIITTTPAFQSNGQFDPEQFRMLLRMNNLGVMEYRAVLANSIMQNQLQAAYSFTGFETPFDLKYQQALESEERTYSYVTALADDYEASVEVSEEAIAAAYQANILRYQNPEQARISYIMLGNDTFIAQQDVSEEDLNLAYQDLVFETQQSEQREVSHILFETADVHSEDEALALAEEARARIENGESFAAVAQDVSEDTGSAADGGALGVVQIGDFDPAFDEALFALEEGEVSQPVVSEFGVHLIRADRVVAADVPSLDEVRDELTASVKEEKAGYQYAEMAQELANLAFSASSLDEVAQVVNLPVQQSEFFTAAQGEGIAENSDIRRIAFEDKMKLDRELSELVETEDGAIVFVVSEFNEAEAKPLAEVRDQIVARLKKEQALAAAETAMQAVISGDAEADWIEVTSIRDNTDIEAPLPVQRKAFQLPEEESAVVEIPSGFAALKVTAVDRKSWTDMSGDPALADAARGQTMRSDMQSYQAWAKANTEIEQRK